MNQLIHHAAATADRRPDRGAGHAELRKRADAEDQARPEDDVDRIREPQHPHRDRGIARATEDGVDEEEHHHGAASSQHDPRERRSGPKYIVARAHEREQLWSEEDADRAEDGRRAEPHQDRLDGAPAGAIWILLADTPRDRGRRADRESDRERVHHRHQRLGDPDGRDGVRSQAADEEHVGDHEDRLHHHLEHHRHCEKDDGTPDGRFREVLM